MRIYSYDAVSRSIDRIYDAVLDGCECVGGTIRRCGTEGRRGERERQREAKMSELRRRFVDGPVLVLPSSGGGAFDMRGATAIGDIRSVPKGSKGKGETMAGYSGTPLSRKLGIKEGTRMRLLGAPPEHLELLAPLPDDVEVVARLSTTTDLILLFSTSKSHLARVLATIKKKMRPDATVWVSWPKKAARVETDITEDVVRGVALPLGFVDVKVCAVDETWSGLKLVIRKKLR